jgi:ankyrin repeat protein
MSLSELPLELLLEIANHLDDARMNALTRTNGGVHNLLNKLLYRRDVTRSPSRSLSWGAEKGVEGTIQRAVDAARNLNPIPEAFHIALQVAAERGHVPIVELLLKVHDVNPNFVGGWLQAAPLLLAAERGHSVIVKLLLAVASINADVGDVRDQGCTPLIHACKKGHVSIVEQLLARHDVNFNARGAFTSTPLIAACRRNRVEIIKLLFTKRGSLDPTIVDMAGNDALRSAASYGYVDIMKLLLDHPDVDPNSSGRGGDTALIHVSRHGFPDAVKLLLDQEGIDVNLQNRLGETALCKAAHYSVKCAKLLLERGDINVNIHDRFGWTALHHACYSRNPLEIMELLLERDDIDPNPLDRNGHSVFFHFKQNSHFTDSHVADRIESVLRAASAGRWPWRAGDIA